MFSQKFCSVTNMMVKTSMHLNNGFGGEDGNMPRNNETDVEIVKTKMMEWILLAQQG